MKTVNKPWIAFKTMAAGAIPPQTAFRYSFLHGADFVLAGMFDYEIADDVKIAIRGPGPDEGARAGVEMLAQTENKRKRHKAKT